MAGQGGLFIKILGGVSEELLSGLATLSDQLKKLSETAKKTKNIEFGNGIAEIGQQVEATSARIGAGLKKIEQFVNSYGDAMASAIDKQDEAAKRAAASTGESFGKIRKDIQDTYGEKQRKLIEQIQQRMEKFGDLSEVDMPTSQTQLKEFAKQIHDLYSSLQDVGAIDESSQTLEEFANKIDYAAVASKRVTKEIKATGDGFRAFSDDARKALGLTKEQNDALAKFKGPTIFEKKLEELRKEQEAGSADAKEYANALQFLAQRFGKSDKEATQYIKVLDNVRQNVERLSAEAKAMGFPNIAENIQKIKPATAVLRALDGSLKLTKNNMELVTDESKKMFKGLSTSEINELINTLDLMPKKAAEIRKVADSFTYSDAEAEQFQKELQALYKELDRISKKDIKLLEGADLKVFEKDINAARSGINKFGGALKVLEGQEGFTQLRTDIERVDIAVKEHRKSLADAAAEQKRYEKEQELTQQTLRDVEKSLRSLSEAELKTFDVEDTRRWKRELERTESTLDNIRKKVPDEEFERLKNNISDLRREADKYATTMRKAAQQMDTKGQEQAMMNLAKQYGDSTSRINRYKKAVRDTVELEQRRMDQIMNKIDRLRSEKKQTEAVTKEIRRLALEYDRLANEEDLSRRVKDRYEEQVKGVSRAHSKLTKELKLSGKEMGFVANQIDHVSRRIKQFGAFVAAAFVVRQIQFFFRELITLIAEYDQALHNLRAIMEITVSQSALLGEVIKDVARSTKFAATEIAEGIQTLGQAGLSMQESMSAVQGIADLATGTLTDFSSVSELVTTTLRSFNLAATETTRIADIFANAINNSKLTVDKLNTAFNYIGAAGKQAGLTLNQLTGTLMNLADNGIRASTMGTGLRRVITKMLAPSDEFSAKLKEMGVHLNELNPSIVGWQSALERVAPALWDSYRGTVDMGKAVEYFGVRAAQVAAILIRNVSDGSMALENAIEKTFQYGSASKMAETQVEGLALKIKNMKDRAGLAVIALGEAGLTAVLKDLIDGLRGASEGIETFVKNWPTAGQFVGTASSVALVTAVISGLIPILSRAKAAWKGLWAIHSTFFAAITGSTVAVTAFIIGLEKIIDRHARAARAAGENAEQHQALAEAMQEWNKSFEEAFQTREWENVIKRFEEVTIAGENLAEMLEERLGYAIENIPQTAEGLRTLTDTFTQISNAQIGKQVEDSIEQIIASQNHLIQNVNLLGEVLPEEYKKLEDVPGSFWTGFLKALDPSGAGAIYKLFAAETEEMVAQYEEGVMRMAKAVQSYASINDKTLEGVLKTSSGVVKRLEEQFGEGSVAAEKFREVMARRWLGPATSEIDAFAIKIIRVKDAMKNHNLTLEEAKERLEDYNIEWNNAEDPTATMDNAYNKIISKKDELLEVYKDIISGQKTFADAERFVREEMDLSEKQTEKYIARLKRLQKSVAGEVTPAFSDFLNLIKEVAPEAVSEIEKMSDEGKAHFLKFKAEFMSAGEELREMYEGLFGGVRLEKVSSKFSRAEIQRRLAGYDAQSAEEALQQIEDVKRKVLVEGLHETRREAEEEIMSMQEKLIEASSSLSLDSAVAEMDRVLEKRLSDINTYYDQLLQIHHTANAKQADLAKDTAQEQITIVRDQSGSIVAAYNELTDNVISQKEREKEKIVHLTDQELLYMQNSFNESMSIDTAGVISDLRKIYDEADSINKSYSFEQFVDQWKLTSKEILSINKKMGHQIETDEKELVNKVLGEINRSTQSFENASAKRVNIKKDENGKIISWEQKLGNDLISAHRDTQTGLLRITSTRIAEEKKQIKTLADIEEEGFQARKEAIANYQADRLQTVKDIAEAEKKQWRDSYFDMVSREGTLFEDRDRLKKEYTKKAIETEEEYKKETIKVYEDVKKKWESILDDRYDKAKEIQEKIIDLERDLRDFQKDTQDILRDMRRDHMTDEEKYYDDLKKYQELMSEASVATEAGRYEEARDLYKEATQLARGLNKEVQEGERTVVTASEAQRKATDMVTTAREREKQMIKELKSAYEEQHKTVQKQIASAKKEVDLYRETIADLQKELHEKMRLDIDSNINEEIGKVNELDRKLTKLVKDHDGKTIKINVDVDDIPQSRKKGGMINQLWSNLKLNRGRKLPGYGGGDIVKALLEPGEFVVRKEAVKKYGASFFYALNQMRVNASEALGSFKARLGASVPKPQRIPQIPRQRFQTGGFAQAIPNLGSLNLIIDNKDIGQIYAEPDVLQTLNKQLQRKNRLRSQ